MKFLGRIITTLLVASLISFQLACKKKSESAASNEDSETVVTLEEQVEEKDISFEKAKDCDDFIDQYEEWSEEYIAFMAKYKDDPVKAVTSPEYSEMMLKASTWSQQWLSLSVSCAQNSKYEERVEEISNRMEQKMEELGFK